MINDFLKKNLTNNALFDDYGLQYNNCPNIDIEIIQGKNSFASLSNKVLIKCSGDDTKDFLNTQFTNDIKKLQNHSCRTVPETNKHIHKNQHRRFGGKPGNANTCNRKLLQR